MQIPGPCPPHPAPSYRTDNGMGWSLGFHHPEDARASSISTCYLISNSYQRLTETFLSLRVRLEVKWVAQGKGWRDQSWDFAGGF